MVVDRAALHAFLTGSLKLGEYPSTLYAQVDGWRRQLLAECKARGVTVHLTGTTLAQVHSPVPTLLADCAAQVGERWADTTRSDGMAWSLSEAVEQVRLCALALDAADQTAKPAPTPAPSSGWKALPVLTNAAMTGERSSHQSAVPMWASDGMHVSLPARGGSPGPGAEGVSGSYQRCEELIGGAWANLTGRKFLRYDFTLVDGFPTDTSSWQAIAQLKNSSTGSPPLELMVNRGQVNLQWHDKGGAETGREVLGKAITGVRHSVVLDVTFSTSATTVTGWMDGVQAFSASHGPTLYPGQSSYGKLGIYRDAAIGKAAQIAHHGIAIGPSFAAVTA